MGESLGFSRRTQTDVSQPSKSRKGNSKNKHGDSASWGSCKEVGRQGRWVPIGYLGYCPYPVTAYKYNESNLKSS